MSQQQRVAVRRGLRDDARADGAAGARAVVDDELLLQRIRQFRRHHTRHGIDTAARRIRHDQGHRAGGIIGCDGHPARDQGGGGRTHDGGHKA